MLKLTILLPKPEMKGPMICLVSVMLGFERRLDAHAEERGSDDDWLPPISVACPGADKWKAFPINPTHTVCSVDSLHESGWVMSVYIISCRREDSRYI